MIWQLIFVSAIKFFRSFPLLLFILLYVNNKKKSVKNKTVSENSVNVKGM